MRSLLLGFTLIFSATTLSAQSWRDELKWVDNDLRTQHYEHARKWSIKVINSMSDHLGTGPDAMYSLAEAVSVKEDWGHSSNIIAVELAQLARVKRLVLFHHEPAYDDARIERVLSETIRYEEISRDGHKVEVLSAYDGLELTV